MRRLRCQVEKGEFSGSKSGKREKGQPSVNGVSEKREKTEREKNGLRNPDRKNGRNTCSLNDALSTLRTSTLVVVEHWTIPVFDVYYILHYN